MGVAGTAFEFANPSRVLLRIRPRLKRARAQTDDLIAAWQACLRGDALCLDSQDGVVIACLRLLPDDTIAFKVLLCVGWREGFYERGEPWVVAIAKALGAQSIIFETARPGWKRLLGPEWQPAPDGFTRSV